jgi:2-methylcitrate dehydratase PrpD
LRRFAEQVEVRADPSLSGVQAVVEIETSDGKTVSARCTHPLGSPEHRLSRAQIEAKFRTYGRERLDDRAEDVIAVVVRLEHLTSVHTLMDMLRAAPLKASIEQAPIAALARA